MRKYIISAGILIVSIFIGNFIIKGLASLKKVKEPKTYRENIPKVNVTSIELKDNIPLIKANGRVQSSKKSEVYSEVRGKITYINPVFKKGQKVTQGSLLIKVDNTPALHTFLASKNSYYNSIASILPDIKLDYKEDYEKWSNYYNKILKEDFPSTLPEIPNSTEKAFVTNRGVYQAYFNLKSEYENLKKFTVYAPYNGTIDDTYQYEGSIINPGAKLFSIVSSSDVDLVFSISSSDVQQLKKGNQVDLIDNGIVYEAKINRISTFLDQNQQSLLVYVNPPKDLNVHDGAYLEGVFHGNPVSQSVQIPRSAIKNNRVLVLQKDSTVRFKNINLISSNLDSVLITNIDKNDIIVTNSPVKLTEGIKVEVK